MIFEGQRLVGLAGWWCRCFSLAVSKLQQESALTVSKKLSLPPRPWGYCLGLLKALQILAYSRIT